MNAGQTAEMWRQEKNQSMSLYAGKVTQEDYDKRLEGRMYIQHAGGQSEYYRETGAGTVSNGMAYSQTY